MRVSILPDEESHDSQKRVTTAFKIFSRGVREGSLPSGTSSNIRDAKVHGDFEKSEYSRGVREESLCLAVPLRSGM